MIAASRRVPVSLAAMVSPCSWSLTSPAREGWTLNWSASDRRDGGHRACQRSACKAQSGHSGIRDMAARDRPPQSGPAGCVRWHRQADAGRPRCAAVRLRSRRCPSSDAIAVSQLAPGTRARSRSLPGNSRLSTWPSCVPPRTSRTRRVPITGSSGMRWRSHSRRAAGISCSWLGEPLQPLITGMACHREEHVPDLGLAGVSEVGDDALGVIGEQPGDHVALAGPHGGVARKVVCHRLVPGDHVPGDVAGDSWQSGAKRGEQLLQHRPYGEAVDGVIGTGQGRLVAGGQQMEVEVLGRGEAQQLAEAADQSVVPRRRPGAVLEAVVPAVRYHEGVGEVGLVQPCAAAVARGPDADVLGPEPGTGRSTLKWPHCSSLIWPHRGAVAVAV